MQFLPININPAQSNAVSENGAKSPFQNMREGQVLKAEVVSAEGGSLTLKMSDGTTLKADFPGAQIMMPGDKLELMMMSKSDGSVHLRLTAVNNQQVQMGTGDLQVRLMDMGIQPSEVNTKAAQFLVNRNIQPTPERVALLVKITMQFPELPAAAAIFMTANNIPATKSNAAMVTQWLQGNGDLGAETQQLMNAVSSFLSEQQLNNATSNTIQQPDFLESNTQADATGKIVLPEDNALTQPKVQLTPAEAKFTAALEQMFNETTASNNASVTTTALIDSDSVEPQAQQQIQLGGQPVLSNAQRAVFQNVFLSVIKNSGPDNPVNQLQQNTVTDFLSTLSNMDEGSAKQAIEGFLSKFQMSPQQRTQATQTMFTAFEVAKSAVATVKQSAPDGMRQILTQPNASATQQSSESAEQPKNVVPQTIPQATNAEGKPQEFTVKQQANVQPQVNQPLDEAAVQEIKQVLQTLGKLTVNVRRDAPVDAENLQNAVKSQQSVADSVHGSLSKIMGETNATTQRAADISSRIQLGNSIDNFYYCQIPIEINKQRNTAELYVFERKHNAGEEGRSKTTILIALETENMGRVETVMRSEPDSLAIEFRVENDSVLKYLEKSKIELKGLLAEEDFAVKDIRVVRMEKPVTPLNIDQVLGKKENFQLQAVDISI